MTEINLNTIGFDLIVISLVNFLMNLFENNQMNVHNNDHLNLHIMNCLLGWVSEHLNIGCVPGGGIAVPSCVGGGVV